MTLRKAKIKTIPPKRGVWWSKAWSYSIGGIHLGTIYQQIYPGKKPKIIFRFDLNGLSLISPYWKAVPDGELGYVSSHYKTKLKAKKALKRALIKYVILFSDIFSPE